MRIYPELRSQPWYDAAGFDLAHALESNYASIRREFLGIDPSAFHPESEDIGRTGSWDVFLLFERGIKSATTARSSDHHPDHRIARHGTNAGRLDLLFTHAAWYPHRGPSRPNQHAIAPASGHPGAEGRLWHQGWRRDPRLAGGKCLVFDDHFEHEAWNATAKDRVVLIIDLWHTDLSPTEVRLLEGLQQYAFANARDLNQYWSRNAQAGHHSG
jgi:aspartate beta-hydroxylase